jgi:hypothetical protein
MMIGINRMVADLKNLGYDEVNILKDSSNAEYAVISNFTITVGSFADRVIDLAIPTPANYPQGIASSIHIKAEPILAEKGRIEGKRNVIDSGLGADWQYWSYSFELRPDNPTSELISQINGIFNNN